jgi:hypothetical protein
MSQEETIKRLVQERMVAEQGDMDKRIAEAEIRMLDVSEKRATEKAQELVDKFSENLSKAEAAAKKEKEIEPKSFLYDPWNMMESLGYKERVMSVSYDTLRLMSERNAVAAAIINTRIHQVTAFSSPPKSKYDIGFQIALRDDEATPNATDKKRMKELEAMIEATGIPNIVEEETRDSFETYLSKITRDTLTYDQSCWEIVNGRGGKPVCFYAIDGSTIRFATTPRMLQGVANFGMRSQPQSKEITDAWRNTMGYQQTMNPERDTPVEDIKYVQIIAGKVMNTYSEKEMAFGVRNPRSDIHNNFYGVSELELLVSVITAHLWAEEYNKRFFSTGSAPKGIIHFEGQNIDQAQLNAFRRQWHAQVSGVWNAWKTPVIGSPGKLNYTNLQMNNRQMEFSNWIDYLIKLMCAIFLIDPAEINFDLKGSTSGQSGPMFESNTEQKLKMSRDRGLKPLLRFLEAEINKNFLFLIDPRYEFRWIGIDAKTEKETQELRLAELKTFKLVDEVRAEYDMDPIGEELGGDLIMDSSYIQWRTQKAQQAQMAEQQEQQQQMGGGGFGGPGGPGEGEEQPDFGQEEGEEQGNEGAQEAGGSMEDLDTHMGQINRMKGSKNNKTRGEGKVGELDELISGLGKRGKK